ncbi:DUF4396 domain-containing protein [Planotetraspora sp. GP83]|uniref:DUF4396 domain-containing protein n=1 Tax=Planotetraspora sp. GP83 TaxID=3156264 RepID=UPI003511DDED
MHCLTGCAVGEVLGMVLGTAFKWPNAGTIAASVALAFFFGYLFSLRRLRHAGLDWRTAVRLALAADTVSILTMEIVDNAVVLIIPGAMDAGLTSARFWGSLVLSLAVAFIVTAPVNKLIIGRGKGHAVIHKYLH